MGLREALEKNKTGSGFIELPTAVAETTEPVLVEIKGKKYELISKNDRKKMNTLKTQLRKAVKFGFDFEATTSDPLENLEEDESDCIVGISFSTAKGTGSYLPIKHDNYAGNWDISVLQEFKDIFESEEHIKVAYNASYEAHMLKKVKVNLVRVHDPMLGINLLRQTMPIYEAMGLKPVVEKVFNYRMIHFDEIVGSVEEPTGEYYKSGEKKGLPKTVTRQRKFNEVPIDADCLEYTCADSDWALQLDDIIIEQLKDNNLYDLWLELDVPLMLCLVDLERTGWHVDPVHLAELKVLATAKIETLEHQIFVETRRQLRLPPDSEIMVPTGKAPKPFNINSSQQLGWLLFDALKLPVINRSKKTDAPSTDAETLEKLGDKVDLPLFKMILEYKKYQKILSTYIIGMGSTIRPNTNRIHTTIDMVFVRTGRFSSSNPNLQNCPRADNDPLGIRNIFLAPKDSLFIFSDYSQIELRIFAWLADEPTMLDAFAKGQDIHARTAWEMFELYKPFVLDKYREDGTLEHIKMEPITVEEVKTKAKLFRSNAKAINFGIIFGLTSMGLANDLWHKTDDEHIRKAQGLLNRYLATYGRIVSFQKELINTARELGYAETMLGRRRTLEDIKSHLKFKKEGAERQALNTPVQGSASEIIKLAMVNIHRDINKLKKNLKMVMQIHDKQMA